MSLPRVHGDTADNAMFRLKIQVASARAWRHRHAFRMWNFVERQQPARVGSAGTPFLSAYSGRRLPLIPVETCHRFQLKVATHSD